MATIAVTNHRRLHALLAAAFVAVCAFLIERKFGVNLGAFLRFASFEAVYVLLPGWMLYTALSPNPGELVRQAAFGTGVGYALEAMAFAATSAAGFPLWFAAYPAVVGIVAVPILWSRRKRSELPKFAIPSPPPIWSWALALTCVALLVYLALSYFVITPLPHQAGAVFYYYDTVWDISCAAEAKHHWPITDPRVAGEPFYYYTFFFMHVAAASRLTGLELSLIVFRLYIVSFFLVFALQLYVAGREMGKSRLCGLLAVIVTLFIGSLQLWPLKMPAAFLNSFYNDLYLSPTYLLGLLILIPLIVEMHDRLTAPDQRGSAGSWFLIVLLLFASGGAKATVLPVFAGGLGVYFIWRLLTDRSPDWPAMAGGFLAIIIFAGWSRLVYSHGGTPVAIRPLASISYMPLFAKYLPRCFHLPDSTFETGGFLLLLLTPFAMAAMVGIRALTTFWILCGGASRHNRAQMWLLSLFAISLLPFLVLDAGGIGQLYFLFNGLAALSISAACALGAMLNESAGWPRTRKLFLFGAAVLLLLNGFFDTPLDHNKEIRAWLSRKVDDNCGGMDRELTQSILAGLEWVRRNSATTDVLAVNNHYDKSARPRYFYYSAFSERRVFLEGWSYSHLRDYDDRLALNDRVFKEADPEALRSLVEQHGVTHLVVDKLHGPDNPRLTSLAKLVFSNPDVTIYSVRPDLLPGHPSTVP